VVSFVTFSYTRKVIISGNVIEVYEYDVQRFSGFQRSSKYGLAKSNFIECIDDETGEIFTRKMTAEEMQNALFESKMSNRQKSNIRARNNLRRLTLSNFDRNSTFLTLTFQENIEDLELANETFKRFVKYMNQDLKKKNHKSLKYVAVIEFQKRGAIHYHLLCDLPKYYSFTKLRNRWRQAISASYIAGTGSTKQERIDKVDNVGAYIVKYMTKEKADERLIGKKMYQTSRGLVKPQEVAFKSDIEFKKFMESHGIVNETKKVYQTNYNDVLTQANVTYTEYNLDR